MQLLIKILIFVVLWLILFSLFVFYTSIRPGRIVTNLSPSDFGLKYEEVNFKSSDGLNLNAWFIPNNNINNKTENKTENKTNITIIVMHGYPADKANLLGVADFLSKDFNVFLFDFRYFGKSEGRYTTVGYLEKDDLLSAIRYLEEKRGITKIGLYGFSLGGAVALMTNHNNVKAIVADSSYANLFTIVENRYKIFLFFKYPLAYLTKLYGKLFLKINLDEIGPSNNIINIKIPILLIHAEKDSQIPVNETYLLHRLNKNSELWIVKGVEHGMSHSTDPKKYEKRVADFFKNNIMKSTLTADFQNTRKYKVFPV